MPKLSREQIVAELDARNISYTEDMSYAELNELLKQAQDAEKPEIPSEPAIDGDMTGVRCGISTIHDHEIRLRRIEAKLNA